MTPIRAGLAAAAAAVLVTAAAGQPPDVAPGLYLRTSYAFGNLSLTTLYVGPGHRIALDPKNGVDPFDWDAAAKRSPGSVGTFTVAGNRLVVTWANGKVERPEVEFEKGVLSAYDGGLVTRADAFPKGGKTLAGTFGGSGQTRNVSGAISLALTADGRYTLGTLGGVRGTPGGTGVAEKTVRGTYKLYGNTLELKAEGGGLTRHTVLPFSTALDPRKAKPSDEHLILDGANLKREK